MDTTFDLNYANPGSVVIDPTNPGNAGPGNLLVIYEGTNTCVGVTKTNTVSATGTFYAALGMATSNDNGKTWPSYRANGIFVFTPLPQQSLSFGPAVPWTSFPQGGPVCVGNICTEALPSPLYGRYGVLSPVVSIPIAASAGPLALSMGNAEPSAFVDDIGKSLAGGAYLYVVHGYVSGPGDLGASHVNPKSHQEIMVARALLGGASKLKFTKWFGNGVAYDNVAPGSFALSTYAPDPTLQNDGSGVESPIFPMLAGAAVGSAAYQTCQAMNLQEQVMGSISYVEETREYLMFFACHSNSEPRNPQNVGPGIAWFYSTLDATRYDPSHQDKWSRPLEIDGSWEVTDNTAGCPTNSANYPSIMSLGVPSGHLSINGGYVFSLRGCPGGGGNELRQYSSRRFSVTTE